MGTNVCCENEKILFSPKFVSTLSTSSKRDNNIFHSKLKHFLLPFAVGIDEKLSDFWQTSFKNKNWRSQDKYIFQHAW